MNQIPLLLKPKLAYWIKHAPELMTCSAAMHVLLSSDYACRHVDLLNALVRSHDYQSSLSFHDYCQLLMPLGSQSLNVFSQSLRRFRHTHLLRLLLREYSGLSSTEESMKSWSDCADAIILKTIAFCKQDLFNRYGTPCDKEGRPAQLYALAMGKLGGQELNYSSDIDLIFLFSDEGMTAGKETLSNQVYYTKLVQSFIQILHTPTADGFVFRVDLRLRPNGESGALVISLAGMETYYQEQGRDWERYAMVKARLIAEETTDWFHRLITPFVYRRYVDYSVIESLRSMKAMIEREVKINPMLNDIKRGLGGIREVEFIVQTMQLIRGGRLPELKIQNTIQALLILKEHHVLPHTQVLKQAYLFLRQLENALQSLNDQQTHVLPEDETKQAQISLVMGYDHWQDLLNKLHQYQRIIAAFFKTVLRQGAPFDNEKRLLNQQLMSFWQDHMEANMAINFLKGLGFQDAERCYQMIHTFRHSPRCRRLSQTARLRLDQFMVSLLLELTSVADTPATLLQVLKLLEHTVGRSAYLALMTENPPVLTELLHWFSHSPFITDLLVNYPFLLEVLLDQDKNWQLPSLKVLMKRLNYKLSHSSDIEQDDEILREFKWVNMLLAARAERYNQYNAMQMSRFLSNVAQVIVRKVFFLACRQLTQDKLKIRKIKSRFAIIAYGKLGSREMNYNSDLDLVFIHEALPEEEPLVTRLTQKVLHRLTTRTSKGILYAVDTRLRPSGEAGLLVSHIDAFTQYQLHHAWIWEYQALMKARLLIGSSAINRHFKRLKRDILLRAHNRSWVRAEVLSMREKLRQQGGDNGIKYGVGGLIDLEFLIQYLVLTHPNETLVKTTHVLGLLKKLCYLQVIKKNQFIELKEAYCCFHYQLHQAILNPQPYTIKIHQENVLKISEELFSEASENHKKLHKSNS